MRNEEISYNTKKALSLTLKELMKKKDLNKITISEITRISNYNRKTFYYHFEGIDDLLLWTLEDEAMLKLRDLDKDNDYKEAIIFAMDYIESNQTVLNCAFNSVGRESLRKLFLKDFYQISEGILNKFLAEPKVEVDDIFKDFLCKMISGATATMIIDYFNKKQDYYNTADKDMVADYIMLIAASSLKASIEEYAKTNQN
ncbi:TetR/AcrR family transcriptional regulator C-terminal domain-containing protein [uncultured Ezakiella sp.]|uniref:TetR/AcrR family transcriptional regulator C-terminal domain-containing protein n=1 Tax=uncultured Ezakiella sp. TaxID=1637529 RepID=UPI0025DA30FA|nr:TetR/AcrR family transcriptional regulator C-terminal domain-containing protein [uncultured Ezakiella sp.]